MAYLIAGCGYTGSRVAQRLVSRGATVFATTRDPSKLEGLAARGVKVLRWDAREGGRLDVPAGLRVLHSLPEVDGGVGPVDPTPALLHALEAPARVVLLSSTGVYGDAGQVDETTEVAPTTERTRLRVEAERLVASGPFSYLVLRPAAIYGADRGVHLAIAKGRYRLPGDGSNYVCRIHVDDLAALAVAALDSELQGAFPVADEEPARSVDVARHCASILGLPMPPSAPVEELHETQRSNRRIDARAIFTTLGVTLRYPSYRQGLSAEEIAPRDA